MLLKYDGGGFSSLYTYTLCRIVKFSSVLNEIMQKVMFKIPMVHHFGYIYLFINTYLR